MEALSNYLACPARRLTFSAWAADVGQDGLDIGGEEMGIAQGVTSYLMITVEGYDFLMRRLIANHLAGALNKI